MPINVVSFILLLSKLLFPSGGTAVAPANNHQPTATYTQQYSPLQQKNVPDFEFLTCLFEVSEDEAVWEKKQFPAAHAYILLHTAAEEPQPASFRKLPLLLQKSAALKETKPYLYHRRIRI